MSPTRVVAALLEADDMLPPDDFGTDPKEFIADLDTNSSIQGVPVRGYYRELENKLRGRTRLKADGPECSFKIENNTYIVLDTVTNNISVKLHWTKIITVTPEDEITVNNGDWYTVTTQARLNAYLPGGWKIYSQKGDWYWWNWREREDSPTGFKKLQPYSNGDRITADGTLFPLAAPVFKKTVVRRKRNV